MNRCLSNVFRRTAAAAGVALALPGAWHAAEARQLPPATHLTSVSVARAGDVTVVAVTGDGALPNPIAGTADDPPRIFLDFAGLSTKTRGIPSARDPAVRRVRAAVHSNGPLVSRVVIDLLAETSFHIDRTDLASGRLIVRVIREVPVTTVPLIPIPPPVKPPPADPAPAPVTPLPPVPALPAPTPQAAGSVPPPATRPDTDPGPPRPTTGTGPPDEPARSTPTRPTASDPEPSSPEPAASKRRGGDRHLQQLGDALDRARSLRSVLAAIDRSTTQGADVLEHAAAEFDSIGRALAGIKAPDAIRSTYDMIVRACTLGAMASRLRAAAEGTADQASFRNAASAAAGALLLIDRACVELGCTP